MGRWVLTLSVPFCWSTRVTLRDLAGVVRVCELIVLLITERLCIRSGAFVRVHSVCTVRTAGYQWRRREQAVRSYHSVTCNSVSMRSG